MSVILLGNEGPIEGAADYEAFLTRLIRLDFTSKLSEPITGTRLAPTIYYALRAAMVKDIREYFVLLQKSKMGLLEALEVESIIYAGKEKTHR